MKYLFISCLMTVVASCIASCNARQKPVTNGQEDSETVNFDSLVAGISSNKVVERKPEDSKKYDESIFEQDYTCDEQTTSGMVEWAQKMAKRESQEVNSLQAKFVANASTSQTQLRKEAAIWNEVSCSLEAFMINNTILANYDGGTIAQVILADAPLTVCFIRKALLTADLSKNKPLAIPRYSEQELLDSIQTLSNNIVLLRRYEANKTLADEGYRYGGKKEYIQYYHKMESSTSALHKSLTQWIAIRNRLRKTLPQSEGNNFKSNTNKQLRTIINLINKENY